MIFCNGQIASMTTACLNLQGAASGRLLFFDGDLRKFAPIFGKPPEAERRAIH